MRMDSKRRRKSTASKKRIVLAITIVLLLSVGVMGTLMYLATKTDTVTNTFEAVNVTCEVQESFDGTVKKDVNVENTSNIDAYLRIKLVTYRVNDNGSKIGGTATIPSFALGDGWFEKDGFYYYRNPVAPGETPAADLIGSDGITLKSYADADGGRQVIEVIAEAIQTEPADVVSEKWNVTVDADGVLSGGSGSASGGADASSGN